MQLFILITKFGETFIGLGTIEYKTLGQAFRKRQYVDLMVHGMVAGSIGRDERGIHISTCQTKPNTYILYEEVGAIKTRNKCKIHHLANGEKLLVYT